MEFKFIKVLLSILCVLSIVGCKKVTLETQVEGQGIVTASGGEIHCGSGNAVCKATLELDRELTLSAVAAKGFLFSGWERVCAAEVESCEVVCTAGDTCTLTMTENIVLKTVFLSETPGDEVAATVLMNFDAAEGEIWPEWTYGDDVTGYGNAGYTLTGIDPNVGEATSTNKIPGTRMQDKSDYGAGNLLSFVTDEVAPGTTGAAAYWQSNSPEDNRVSWWVWYDNYTLSSRDIADEDTDRMSFYIKIEGMDDNIGPSGGSNYGFHVGTYDCAIVADGCPKEGPGNQHYYHYLGFNSGAWIHAELDEQPQHLRGYGRPQVNNPVATSPEIYDGYFANMHQFYMEIRNVQDNPTEMWLDEITYRSTKDSVEPDQNQQSITSVWVGYWAEDDKWQISWSDEWQDRGDHTNSTFEVRYSASPITNDNFDAATPVVPLHFTGPDYESNPSEYAIRRPDSYAGIVWTDFQLPDALESSGNMIYFAIKDISVAGGNAGLSYPFNRADGKNPPNNFIRAINYAMP